MRCQPPDELPARSSIVDAEEYVSAEVRRRPRPENGRLDFLQVEGRRGRRNSAADGFGDRRHGRSLIGEYREQAARLAGEASLGLLFRYLSTSRLVTIAQIEGRVRGAGSEFVLACDMRFAAKESAIFSQPEQGFGLLPGAGGIQHLTRLMGRARALEVMLSADDYDAELAERYGWINRALSADALSEFVRSLAHRIAGFPVAGRAMLKDRVNEIALAQKDDFRRDSDLFLTCARDPESQRRTQLALTRGFQTHSGEMALAEMVGNLAEH
jgi:enoyl-CoA hydratase/carnithine racemase